MLHRHIQDLGKQLQDWHYKLSRANSPEQALSLAKEVSKEIEKIQYTWREQFEKPIERLGQKAKDVERLDLKRAIETITEITTEYKKEMGTY